MFKLNWVNLSLVVLFSYSLAAEAKLYKWVDDKGITHYGEIIPPEYSNRERDTFNKSGVLQKRKDFNAEALRAKKEADRKENPELIEQERRDNALLNTYSNEKEIDLALDRSLVLINARIESNQMLLKSSQTTLEDLKQEADHRTKLGRKIPQSLTDDISQAVTRVDKFKTELHNSEEELNAVRTRFENEKALYRKLKGITPSNPLPQ
jgi:ribosomal protein L29